MELKTKITAVTVATLFITGLASAETIIEDFEGDLSKYENVDSSATLVNSPVYHGDQALELSSTLIRSDQLTHPPNTDDNINISMRGGKAGAGWFCPTGVTDIVNNCNVYLEADSTEYGSFRVDIGGNSYVINAGSPSSGEWYTFNINGSNAPEYSIKIYNSSGSVIHNATVSEDISTQGDTIAFDSHTGTSYYDYVYKNIDNSPPVIENTFISPTPLQYTEEATVGLTATDPDNDTVTRTINVKKDGTEYMSGLENDSSIVIDEKYIDWTFEFVATDSKGNTDTKTVTNYVDDKFPLLDAREIVVAETEAEFANWEFSKSNMEIGNGGVAITDSPASYTTEKFNAEKTENLNVSIDKTDGIKTVVTVYGYDSNNSQVSKENFTASHGTNEYDIGGMTGESFDIVIENSVKDGATGNQNATIKRVILTGQMESFAVFGYETNTVTETVTEKVFSLGAIGGMPDLGGLIPNVGNLIPSIELPTLSLPDMPKIPSLPSLSDLGL